MYNDDIVVYNCKDGRSRVYIKETKKVMSYPKYLMEKQLGRKLQPNEQVHHKDHNYANNNLDNLEIKLLGEHQRSHKQIYSDTQVQCAYCGKLFIKTAKQMQYHRDNCKRRNLLDVYFCSKQCTGKYGKDKQLGRI